MIKIKRIGHATVETRDIDRQIDYYRQVVGLTMVELFIELDRMHDEERVYFEPRPWHRDRPQRPKVWDGKVQRDMWGLPPSPDFLRAEN